MAGRKTRRDPYRNFNFQVMFGAALTGLAALAIAKKAASIRRNTESGRRNSFWRMFG